jgi:FMN-dependent NADH-azoreductase
MSLLHIDSSILGGNSVSRSLSAAVVARLRAATPGLHVTYRDLAASPVSHLSGAYLAGQSAEVQHDQAMQEDLRLGGEVLEEFLAADIVVIGWRSTTSRLQPAEGLGRPRARRRQDVPLRRKGAEGLAGGKRVILAVCARWLLRAGQPDQAYEHAESYMRTVLGFIGIHDPEVVVARASRSAPSSAGPP